MAIVAATRTEQDYRLTPLPERNAVGQEGQSLRTRSESELRDFVIGSIYWRRNFFLLKAYSKLSKLCSLQNNWDSYGAPSPNENAFQNAGRILKWMKPSDLELLNVVPSAEGGIGFCFKVHNRYADIEAMNDGTILGVRYVGMEAPILIELDGSDESIKQGLEEIRQHIDF